MAREKKTLTITDEGRDQGKTFVITEMSASKAEAWAIRVLMALAASGVELPDGMDNFSMAVLAQVGLKALMSIQYETLEPLLAEMMECVQIQPSKTDPYTVRPLDFAGQVEEDIQEIQTRFKLRIEVFQLHAGFLKAVAPLISRVEQATAAKVSQ